MPFVILQDSSQHVVKLFYIYCPIYICITCACLYLVLVWSLDACSRNNLQQYGRKAVFKMCLTTTRWRFDAIGYDMPLLQKWIIGLKLKTQFHICVYHQTSNTSRICRRCSNYIFIHDFTPGFNGLGWDNCKTRRESFKYWDLMRLISKILR